MDKYKKTRSRKYNRAPSLSHLSPWITSHRLRRFYQPLSWHLSVEINRETANNDRDGGLSSPTPISCKHIPYFQLSQGAVDRQAIFNLDGVYYFGIFGNLDNLDELKFAVVFFCPILMPFANNQFSSFYFFCEKVIHSNRAEKSHGVSFWNRCLL